MRRLSDAFRISRGHQAVLHELSNLTTSRSDYFKCCEFETVRQPAARSTVAKVSSSLFNSWYSRWESLCILHPERGLVQTGGERGSLEDRIVYIRSKSLRNRGLSLQHIRNLRPLNTYTCLQVLQPEHPCCCPRAVGEHQHLTIRIVRNVEIHMVHLVDAAGMLCSNGSGWKRNEGAFRAWCITEFRPDGMD